MNDGWIKLYRKTLDWEWFTSPLTAHFFSYLLLVAKDKEERYKGFTVKRGDAIIGRYRASKETGLSEQEIRTCIKRLKSTNEITTKSTNRFTIVTICNYDTYQAQKKEINQRINQQPNQQSTSNQPAINQQLTTLKEVKNIEVKNIRSKEKEKSIKEKEKYLDFVFLKKEEYNKLIERFGKPETTERIERLNNYLGSTGRKYKSHYHTILSWAEKDKRENKGGSDEPKDTGHSKYDDVPVIKIADM